MATSTAPRPFAGRELLFLRCFFLIAALWNLTGSLPGLFDSAGMFAREFGRDMTDPVMTAVCRGAWATSFLCGCGFLMVAWNPDQHTGVVVMGGIGKALFAINLAHMYQNGWTSGFALVVVGGDFIFVALFLVWFARLRQPGHSLV